MKKNVYTVQVDYSHGKEAFLPYASGTLIASAQAVDAIRESFEFMPPFFRREKTDEVLEKIKEPFLVGFSNYIWNYEYNRVLAQKIKNRYPGCHIVFGGHNVTPDASLLDSEPYVDYMIIGEGEEVFPALLLALAEGRDPGDIPNIAFRRDGKAVITRREKFTRTDYPSPYLAGVFDPILEDNPDLSFFAVMETARGCPYNCAYCDDGAAFCKLRKFPDERIYGELQWLADRKIFGFGLADSNFGMFERDEKYTDEMIRLKKEYGYPVGFQVSYAKESNDRVFSINKKLNDAGMSKGATISFQSMNPEVQKNIFRHNLSIDSFESLLRRYNAANVPTYTELILGLPGETFESFVKGIDILLNAGQHGAIYTHNCEWLPLSGMGDPEYNEKYGIRKVRIPINQPHCTLEEEEVTEYSRIIVRTNSMSEKDWIRMNLYSVTVQAFHHHGFLMCFALYLHYALGIDYSAFYLALLKSFEEHKDTVGGRALSAIESRLEDVTEEKKGLVFEDRRFGNTGWPEEEYAVLCCVYESDRFYEEIKDFLSSFFEDKDIFEELLRYQRWCLKTPFEEKGELKVSRDYAKYFSRIITGDICEGPEKAAVTYRITKPIEISSWEEYAAKIVWYGRKTLRKIYLDEIESLRD